jgi:hypothetical protein
MAKKKSKTKAEPRADKAKRTKKREPPAKMIVRPTAAPARKSASTPAPSKASQETDNDERTPLAERVASMGASHITTAAGAGVVSTAASVFAVGKGWASPKLASGLVAGTGAATTAAGYHWEWDHVMAAGVGMTASGGVMLSGQYAVDLYQGMEKRAAEKRAKNEAEKESGKEGGSGAKDRDKADNGRRNARRIVIDSQEPDDAVDEYDDYPAHA